MRSRAALPAAGLAVVLVPLLVIPMVRAREAPPERPGLDAFCPDLQAGGPPFALPTTSADAAGREAAMAQAVPSDGGPATFTPQGTGGGGGAGSGPTPSAGTGAGGGSGSGSGSGTGTGAGSGSGAGSGTGTGTGTGSGTGGGSGSGAGTPGAPGTGGTSGPATGPGRGTDPTGEDQPAPTVPPSEAAQEVTADDVEEHDRSPLPWPALLLLLLVAAAAAAYAMRRRPADPATTPPGPGTAAKARRRPRHVEDDLERRVREAFVSGLLDLDRAGIVAYDESLPSSWIARRLVQSRSRRAFGQASVTFDEIVYGRRPPSIEDVERIRSGFADILASSPR